MRLEDIDVLELLPQRPPFVLVSRLTHFDMTVTRTQYDVPCDGIFTDDGSLSPSGVIENMAQTCAARMGYYNKYILKNAVRLGFIGAIRDLHLHRLPQAGEIIDTEVVVREDVFGLTLVDATVRHDEEVLAQCEMKIAVSEEMPCNN